MSWETDRLQYANKAKTISEKITKILGMETGDIITDSIRTELQNYQLEAEFIRNKLEKNEFEIAVVGLEKAGKSSFSNAFIEKNMLPTDDGRCTYTATCIRYADEDKAVVEFYGQKEFEKDFVDKLNAVGIEHAESYSYQTISLEKYKTLYEQNTTGRNNEMLHEDICTIIENKDEISRYLGMPEKVYTKDGLRQQEFQDFIRKPGQAIAVKEVSIYSRELGAMQNAVIYDVPGFNSPTRMHKEQTLEKMSSADAIVMVAKGDEPSLTGDILKIFKESDEDGTQLSDKLFVFANKSDRATDFVHNKEKTYEEWVGRYQYVKDSEKDKRIVFGSANAHLQSCKQLQGDNFIRSVEEKNLPYGDGIERMKFVLEEYNQVQRAETLKGRIRRLQKNLKKLFPTEGRDQELSQQNDISKLQMKALMAAQKNIPEMLEDYLNDTIKMEMKGRPLSNHIIQKINNLTKLEDYGISESDIDRLHKKHTGMRGEEVSRVEGDIRKTRFEDMYGAFSKEIVDMVLDTHKQCEKQIINKCIEAIGVEGSSGVAEELRKRMAEFLADIIKGKDDYYQSLVERFSRDIYEILIRTPYTYERGRAFFDNSDTFYSMSIFYRTERKETSYLDEKIVDLPMCKMLLFHTYKKEKENVEKACEKIRELAIANNEELMKTVKLLGRKAPLHVLEIVTDVCREVGQTADEYTRVSDAEMLLHRQLSKYQASTGEENVMDIVRRDQFEKQYSAFHARRGVRDYEMLRQDFSDDIEVLRDILQNAFVYAIDIEKPFLAREQKIIEDIKNRVETEEFANFLIENTELIRHEEYSAINKKGERERLNRICRERIRSLLEELDQESAV